jgi:hypothetical protein
MRFNFPLQLFSVGQRIAIHFFTQRVENFSRGSHAQIGGKQSGLQFLQQCRADPALTLENCVDSAFLVLLTEVLSLSRSVGSGGPKSEIIRLSATFVARSEIVAEARAR